MSTQADADNAKLNAVNLKNTVASELPGLQTSIDTATAALNDSMNLYNQKKPLSTTDDLQVQADYANAQGFLANARQSQTAAGSNYNNGAWWIVQGDAAYAVQDWNTATGDYNQAITQFEYSQNWVNNVGGDCAGCQGKVNDANAILAKY